MNTLLIKSGKNSKNFRTILIWRICRYLIYISIPLVVCLNFYGLFTHKFYWLKLDNFILPVAVLIHLLYQREVQKRITQTKGVDFSLQKLEFAMYGVVIIYVLEIMETLNAIILSNSYDSKVFPESFWSQALSILSIQILFTGLTVCSFYLRKQILGAYNFDQISNSRSIIVNN
jgi:hypothetical protein